AGVGDVDGVLADAFAELAKTAARTTRADDRRVEFGECLAKLLGHDAGERQHGRGSGDLDRVTCSGNARRGRDRDGGDHEGSRQILHCSLLSPGIVGSAGAAGTRRNLAMSCDSRVTAFVKAEGAGKWAPSP